MKKVLAAIGIIFVFSMIKTVFEGMFPNLNTGYGISDATRSAVFSGIIAVIYYGIMMVFIKMAFSAIDEKDGKKDAASKEEAFRKEREERQRKAAEELDNKLASGHFEAYQIEALIRGTNITPEQKDVLRKKYLCKTETAGSNSEGE